LVIITLKILFLINKAYQVQRKMKIRAMLIVAKVSCNMSMVQFNKLFGSFEMSLHCIASCIDTKLDIFTTKIVQKKPTEDTVYRETQLIRGLFL